MLSKKICLIQLVSEETMQNLLPILAIKPSNVVHISTAKTAKRSNWIAEGARQSNVVVSKRDIQLEEMPGIKDTFNAVDNAIREASVLDQASIVNFTGGTKLMSIGAYQAAMANRTDSVYVDTEHLHFTDGETSSGLSEILKNDFSFNSLSRALSVNSIAVANGSQRITGGKDWHPYLPIALHLRANPDDENRCWESVFGTRGLSTNGKEPRTPADWLKLWDMPLNVPETVGNLSCSCNMLERRNDGKFYLLSRLRGPIESLPANSTFTEYSRAINPVQFILSFFSGGWWEVAVANASLESGLFQDIRWSVNVGAKYSGPDKEEDIVAVQGVQAVYISCKRGGQKARLLGQLDEMNNRAKTIGGRFVKQFLAVYLPLTGRSADNVFKRAKELNITIIQPQDIEIKRKSF